MWVYRLGGTKKYLATNPKVMTSALNRQPSLSRVVEKRCYVHLTLGSVSPRFGPNYTLLARNPFSRVESFFREKMRIRVHEALEGAYELKRHQAVFYPWIGVSASDSLTTRCQALLNLSFPEFVALLPNVAHLEDHLNPQIHNYTRWIGPLRWAARFDRVVHIEDSDEMTRIADEFDLDLRRRDNDSSKAPADLTWSPAAVSVVRDVYRDDFSTLGYDRNDHPFLSGGA